MKEFFEEIKRLLCRRNALIACTGSPLRMDDRAGLVLYSKLAERGYHVVECEYGLENCLIEIVEQKPEVLLVVDAVYGEKLNPGDIVLVDENSLEDTVFPVSTHSIPLKQIIDMIKSRAGVKQVFLLGIRAKNLGIGDEISEEVLSSINYLADLISKAIEECRRRTS